MSGIFRIGVTGPTGAGKGALSAILSSSYGIPVFDADKIYHGILEQSEACKKELADNFGSHIISDGRVDRRALAAVVFAEGAGERLLLLNSITHRYVKEETERLISDAEARGLRFAIIDAPLLIEANMHLDCDKVICVLASKDVRLERIMARDKISREAALSRISKQKTDDFYISHSDFTIYNDRDIAGLAACAKNIASALGITEENK